MQVLKTPPSPKRYLPGGHFIPFRRNALAFLTSVAGAHGDIVHLRFASQLVYFINHPDYVKDVLTTNNHKFIKGRALQRAKRVLGEGLLTNEGENHKRQRRLMQPAFHRQRLIAYAEMMMDEAARLNARWRAQGAGEIDIHHEMMRLTLAIVGRTLFSAHVESDADEVGAALTSLLEMFNLLLLPFSELLEKLPLPHIRRLDRSRAKLDRVIYGIINERRRSSEDKGDLLSMLLLAQDEEAGGAGMSDEQVRDEALTLFLAGHETTANALTFTWYLLAQHPEIEAKLHAELQTVLAGRAPTFDDVPRLKYTEQIFTEAMRLYPPAWALGRLSTEPHEIGGYLLPAQSLVLMSPYVTQRDARWYDRPEEFIPERWTDEFKKSQPAFTYFPFGGGARRCIGEAFAWTEGILLIAALAQNWRLRLVPRQPFGLQANMTLRAKHPVKMQPESRL